MIGELIHIDKILTLALNGSISLFLDGVATSATATLTWIPLAVVFLYIVIKNNDMSGIFMIVAAVGLCIFIADQTASTIFKPMICRYRPANDPQLMYLVDIVNDYRGGRYGFFSSHAANTFAVATFCSLLVRYRNLSIGLFSWAVLNCWTRVYLGVHYVGDLIVGTFFGLIVGACVYGVFVRLRKHKTTLPRYYSETQTMTGYAIKDIQVLILVLVSTYIYVLFSALFIR